MIIAPNGQLIEIGHDWTKAVTNILHRAMHKTVHCHTFLTGHGAHVIVHAICTFLAH